MCLRACTLLSVRSCGCMCVQHTRVFRDHSKSVHLSAFKPEPLAKAHNSANRAEGDREAAFAAAVCSEKFVKAPAGWMYLLLLKRCPLFCPVFPFSP